MFTFVVQNDNYNSEFEETPFIQVGETGSKSVAMSNSEEKKGTSREHQTELDALALRDIEGVCLRSDPKSTIEKYNRGKHGNLQFNSPEQDNTNKNTYPDVVLLLRKK